MVKLRLARRGRKKAPFYNIVAIDSRARRDGAFLERIGTVDTMTSPSTITINHERAIYWLGVGAQPTDVVRAFLSADGVLVRRHMQFKNASADEIETAVTQHQSNTKARFERNKAKRAARKAAPPAAEGAAEGEAAAE